MSIDWQQSSVKPANPAALFRPEKWSGTHLTGSFFDHFNGTGCNAVKKTGQTLDDMQDVPLNINKSPEIFRPPPPPPVAALNDRWRPPFLFLILGLLKVSGAFRRSAAAWMKPPLEILVVSVITDRLNPWPNYLRRSL